MRETKEWGAWTLDGQTVSVSLSEHGVHIDAAVYRWDELRSVSPLEDSWLFTPRAAPRSMRIRPPPAVDLKAFLADVAFWRAATERRLRAEIGAFMGDASKP